MAGWRCHTICSLPAPRAKKACRSLNKALNLRRILPWPSSSVCLEEPEFELYDSFPATVNDDDVTERVSEVFAEYFGERCQPMAALSASEDFSDIPNALGAPHTYWGIGGIDEQQYRPAAEAGRVAQDIPVNHSPTFAPVIQPTLDTGTEALVIAALAWLAR